MRKFAFILFLITSTFIYAQTATVKGVVNNEFKTPIEGVAITCAQYGAETNQKGEYILTIPAGIDIIITYSHVTYKTFEKKFNIPKNKTLNYSPTLTVKVEEMEEVIVKNETKEAQGILKIDPADAVKITSAKGGVETVLLALPGVNNNNELSTQYNVRGGNFDENLVYVNGIEVYRPFLINSGQQEGLSFVNENLVQNINFSAGGFQAKYGDKLSSVLDITYRTPKEFAAGVNASLMGAKANVEGTLFNNKLSALLGARYQNNSMFINSKDIETNTKPNFTDVQLFLSYFLNSKFKIDFLGVYSLNNYNYTPISRKTNFGTLTDPKELIVFYDGQEKDSFETLFGAVNGTYTVNENLHLGLTLSSFHTIEQERYDILANYNLSEFDSDFNSKDIGNDNSSPQFGTQLDHARNNLDALIGAVDFKGTYKKNKHQVDFGIKYKHENFRDQLKEYEVLDSIGYNVRPLGNISNNEPYQPYDGAIVPFNYINAKNNISINRFVLFAQYSKNSFINSHKIWYNLGGRAHYWTVSDVNNKNVNQATYSLRGQFAIKPDWDNDMLFRISGGMYNQPPFYDELRNPKGEIIPTVKAQKSLQAVIGNEFSFDLWNRPFKLISEAYYKHLTDVNIYTVDNVKITYLANNNAVAYAAGLDFRLNGEFVPGTDSWISIGFLKTEENYDNLGYIARPTDQRFKFAMLFQDYIPNIPSVKMYLNLVYNTGVPGGSPANTNPYNYQNRLNDYKRADIGITYVFTDAKNVSQKTWLKGFKELAFGVEIFNLFDIQNSITNTWVRDVYSKEYYAIPNYMTSRVFNLKLDMKF
ncbi:carboxypeptidase-like regulatory domain-containing protein [Lutibacter sp. HS1-25]|uniref:TonB-dependent receptor n=1 Tax=Lutibacter sp. HS1-25 TaxID=2485000 RepID=UPI0026B1CDCA